jgi:hypothetical protein
MHRQKNTEYKPKVNFNETQKNSVKKNMNNKKEHNLDISNTMPIFENRFIFDAGLHNFSD